MDVLVTAGGTSEPIDNVRSITNHSSGGLGKAIAESFLAAGHTVTYVTTKHALRPTQQLDLSIKEIETTVELATTLEQLFAEKQFDAIVHAMAVSDFTTETAQTEEQFIDSFAQQLSEQTLPKTKEALATIVQNTLNQIADIPQTATKISSDTDRLLIFLKKNPKVIQMIRDKQPQTVLVGFKLLVDVSQEELVHVAQAALVKNRCDFVLANDLMNVHETEHAGLLINETGIVQEACSKQGIGSMIVKNVEKKWREQQ